MSIQGQFGDAELDVAVESEPEDFGGDRSVPNEAMGGRAFAVTRPVSDWSALDGTPFAVRCPNVAIKMEEEEVSDQVPVAVGSSLDSVMSGGIGSAPVSRTGAGVFARGVTPVSARFMGVLRVPHYAQGPCSVSIDESGYVLESQLGLWEPPPEAFRGYNEDGRAGWCLIPGYDGVFVPGQVIRANDFGIDVGSSEWIAHNEWAWRHRAQNRFVDRLFRANEALIEARHAVHFGQRVARHRLHGGGFGVGSDEFIFDSRQHRAWEVLTDAEIAHQRRIGRRLDGDDSSGEDDV